MFKVFKVNPFLSGVMLAVALTFTVAVSPDMSNAIEPVTGTVNNMGVDGIPVNMQPVEGSAWIKMFEQLVGSGAVQKIIYGDELAMDAGTGSVFMAIMSVLVTVVLAGGGLLISFNTIMGTYNTATQGEVMGKSWDTWMVPLRTAGAITALIPLPAYGGLALCQVFLISSIGVGIGFADTAWTSIVTSMVRDKTPISALPNDPAIAETVKAMLITKVCALTMEGVDGTTQNWYEKGLGEAKAAELATKGLGNKSDSIPFVFEEVQKITADGSYNNYIWTIGPFGGYGTPVRVSGRNGVGKAALKKPRLAASCGKITFKSGIVPVDIAEGTMSGDIRTGIKQDKFDIVGAMGLQTQNAVTMNNRKRMINMWNNSELNDLAALLASGKFAEADRYRSLINIVNEQQKAVRQDLESGGIGADGNTNASGLDKTLEDKLIKMVTAEGSVMAGSFYWTLSRVQSSIDQAMLASAPESIDMKAVQKAFKKQVERGLYTDGSAAGGAAVGAATGAVIGAFFGGVGAAPGAAIGAVAGFMYTALFYDNSEGYTGQSLVVSPTMSIPVGDILLLSDRVKGTIRFLIDSEESLGMDLSGSIGGSIESVATGGVGANTDGNKDWDQRTAELIGDAIRYSSMVPSSSLTADGSSQHIVVRSDPMTQMRFLGNSILQIGTICLTFGTTSMLISKVLPASKVIDLADEVSDITKGGSGSIFAPLMMILGIVGTALLALGIVLAFIIPALPYTTWTLSLLTYMIVFAESMVASLFWALSHAWPEGEGLASSISKKGYMLYLQVIFTPILMLAGFFIGMQLVFIMGWWVDNTLFSSLSSAYSGDSNIIIGSSMGIFGSIGMLIVYTGLMFSIVWKSFDMTAELKNWVFEWIGGSPRAMGENQSQQQHIMGAVGTAKQAGSQGLNSAVTSGGGKGNSDAQRKINEGGGGNPTGINATQKQGQH